MAFKSPPTFFSLARPCPNRLCDQVAPHWTLTFFISCPGAGRPRHQVLPTWTLKLFMFLLCSKLVGTCTVPKLPQSEWTLKIFIVMFRPCSLIVGTLVPTAKEPSWNTHFHFPCWLWELDPNLEIFQSPKTKHLTWGRCPFVWFRFFY